MRSVSIPPPTLRCVANFPAGTGYAWDDIEGTFAQLADALALSGVRTHVIDPRPEKPPKPRQGSAVQALAFDGGLQSARGVAQLAAHCQRENVRAVYFSDRPTVHPGYAALRMCSCDRIIC